MSPAVESAHLGLLTQDAEDQAALVVTTVTSMLVIPLFARPLLEKGLPGRQDIPLWAKMVRILYRRWKNVSTLI